jgi:multiple sugar transport system ATP-binding protein
MASIAFRNVNKRWGHAVGVDDLTLDVHDKEFLVLLGPSGCGKTTTMRMIAGLEEPTDGEIWIGDQLMNGISPRDRDVAMVFQNYGLYPHMTVRENIGYPLKVRGIPKAEAARQVAAAAAKVELTPYLDRKPGQMSGGQRQRVALARALVRTPQVFLMDEPLSNLDAKLRVTMRAQLKHLHHELQITTVYVTHDQMEAMTLASRVAVMSGGVIQQLGTPEAIYDDPANLFVAGFIGSPGMNLLHGDLRDGDFIGDGIRVSGVGGGSRAGVVLGIRPEDLEVADLQSATLSGPVYAFELTGDAVFVTLSLAGGLLCARGPRRLRCEIGDVIGISLDPARAFLFAADSGERLRQVGPPGFPA